jgi:hypothetical protein
MFVRSLMQLLAASRPVQYKSFDFVWHPPIDTGKIELPSLRTKSTSLDHSREVALKRWPTGTHRCSLPPELPGSRNEKRATVYGAKTAPAILFSSVGTYKPR